MAVTHVRIDRSETFQGGRIVSIDELRSEYLPDLDLTGVPDDEVGATVEAAIWNHDDPYGSLYEWIDKHNECTDSETKVTAFRHVCAGCGEPIMQTENGWHDAYYWRTCGGWNADDDAPAHKPTVEPKPEPTRSPLDAAQDAATDALKALIRLHLADCDGDHQDLAFAINGVLRDAYTETLDADSPEPINDTPRADLIMDLYPSWPQLEDALDDARAITRDDAKEA